MSRRGFTLIELLLAITILVVIVAIVYASLSTTVYSTAAARADAEEMRLRQFLAKSFSTNFSTVFSDRTNEQTTYQFVGVDDQDSEGPKDSVRFISTAPLMGGMALPGDLKEVRYEVSSAGGSSDMGLSAGDTGGTGGASGEPGQGTLQATETPLIAGNVDRGSNVAGATAEESFLTDPNYESPQWSVPVRSLDFKFFDGQDWLDEWDSTLTGRLPWCVHIRINFAKTKAQLEEDKAARYDTMDDPDFEMVIPIPIAMGLTEDPRSLSDFSGQSALQQRVQQETEAVQQQTGGSTATRRRR